MSGDGSVIVGNDQDLETAEAAAPFVWQQGVGKQHLADRLASSGADLSGWSFGDVITVSRDGTVVLGNGTCHGVPALYRAKLAATTE